MTNCWRSSSSPSGPLRRPNDLRRLPLGIEGVRVRPSLRGLVRDLMSWLALSGRAAEDASC